MRSQAFTLLCCAVACAKPQSEPQLQANEAPLWAATSTQPSLARAAPAVTLPNGTVLVVGGGAAATELFTPANEVWSAGAVLAQPQSSNALSLWSGRALTVDGPRVEALSGATWQSLLPPAQPRTASVLVPLADGRVLLVAGQGAATALDVLELDGGWAQLAPSSSPHADHTATLLPDGRIAVIGTAAELYDPVANLWSPVSGVVRDHHTASLLPSGQLLLVGGGVAPERWDPVSNLSTPVAGLRVPRLEHSAVSLPNGDVLVTGGVGAPASQSAERYLVALDRFVASGCLDTPRRSHAGAVLEDGGVLLVGGIGLDGGALARSERLDFSTGLLAQGQPCGLDCECGTGFCVDGVCCNSACTGGPCLGCGTGTCALKASGSVCRAAAGLCDLAETCSGTDAGCPADALRGPGFTCRGPAGTCDVVEACDGVTAQCPADRVVDAGASCRAPAGLCDARESCDGLTGVCPSDRLVDAGVTCRAAVAGGCDIAEICTGASAQCPSDSVADAGVVCRARDGGCDLVETCNGTSALCPNDLVAASGVSCRPATGPCDVEEVCTGGRACPADLVRDAGASCRAASGLCDVADVCDGLTGLCVDRFVDAGAACRAAVAGGCDLAETCSGAAPQCPVDVFVDAGTTCRGALGACDRAEACTGTSASCPPDTVQAPGVMCRAASGLCDAVESCDGVSGACPADGLKGATEVCRPSAGDCDVAESCSGSAVECPADALRGASEVCRPSAGSCDLAESCSGTSAACPADGFASSDVVCRPSSASCDPEERCDGTAASCPGDDAGTCDQPKHYAGWSCASAPSGPWGLLGLLLVLLSVRRSSGGVSSQVGAEPPDLQRPAHAYCSLTPALSPTGERGRLYAVFMLFLSSSAWAQSAPITSDFAIRISANFLRALPASRIGGELGAAVSLTPRFDANLALSLGQSFGGRLGVSWHLKDEGEWVRPFVQLRGLLHVVPEGIAGGGGAWAGVFVPAGPGRITGGVLLEAYVGPKGYVPWDAFVTLGYELDLYRRIERAGQVPEPDFGGTHVPPIAREDAPVSPPPAEPEPVKPPPPPSPEEPARTRVVTRVSLSKDLLYFEERRTTWMPKSEPTLKRVVEVLKRYPQLQRVEISGHADDADSDDECMKLALKRAERVLEALLQAGIEPSRLTAKAYGRQRNRVPTAAPARKREPNRRVDFTVLQEAFTE